MIEIGDGYRVSGDAKFNVILGKNGSGKSTMLRQMDQHFGQRNGCVRYITPEIPRRFYPLLSSTRANK